MLNFQSMKILYFLSILTLGLFFQYCSLPRYAPTVSTEPKASEIRSRVVIRNNVPARTINTKNVSAEQVVQLAESLQGVPYVYGGSSKEKGFDCSGLVWYVLKQYKISAPRTSVEYTNAGKEVPLSQCKRGDIILFTGSDANSGVVGHMGMITSNDHGYVQFINAISGEGNGVMISKLSGYFVPRFVKVIRVFNSAS